MKFLFILSFFIFLLACNSGTDHSSGSDTSGLQPVDTLTTFSPIDSSTQFLDSLAPDLQPWLEQTTKSTQVRLKDFKYADNWVEDSLVIRNQNLVGDFLKTYESVLVYSPDKKKALDLGSYGTVITKDKKGQTKIEPGEPDVEVAVIDLQSKKRRRIFFSGPGSSVEKGFWMNDSTIVLAGKNQQQNVDIPMLWLISLGDSSNFIKRYEYAIH